MLVFRHYGILWVLILSYQCVAAQVNIPKYSNEFLSVGVGARALGMGGTSVSTANDASAVYWNPSLQVDLESEYNGSLMHNEYFGGIASFDFLGFSTKIDSVSSFGIGLIRFGIDNIPDTRFLYDANGAINYDNIRFFSAADYGVFISYARKLRSVPDLNIGGNLKVVHRSAGNFANAWGFGLDVSASYSMKSFKFGIILRDVTTTFNAWTHSTSLVRDVYAQTGNSIPQSSVELTLPSLLFSSAYNFTKIEDWRFTLTSDVLVNFDRDRNTLVSAGVYSISPGIGFETGFREMIFLRAGINQFQYKREIVPSERGVLFQPGLGAGFSLKKFGIDYALTNQLITEDAFYSHIFSLNIYLNSEKD